jgi:Mor family transcriptional regulator
MKLSISEKIQILLGCKGMAYAQLAKKTKQSRQNLYNKIKRNNFTEKEANEIAEALEVEFVCFFRCVDGTEI